MCRSLFVFSFQSYTHFSWRIFWFCCRSRTSVWFSSFTAKIWLALPTPNTTSVPSSSSTPCWFVPWQLVRATFTPESFYFLDTDSDFDDFTGATLRLIFVGLGHWPLIPRWSVITSLLLLPLLKSIFLHVNTHVTCLFVCSCQTTSLSSSCPCQRTGLRSTSWWLRRCPIRERESCLTNMAMCCLFIVCFLILLCGLCPGGSAWSHNVPKPWRPNLTTTHLQLRLSESDSVLADIIITFFFHIVSNVIVLHFSALSGTRLPLRSSTVGFPGHAKILTEHQVEVSAWETAMCATNVSTVYKRLAD